MRIILDSVVSFFRNNYMQLAAALAYYGMFALLPFLLLTALLLGKSITSSQEALNGLHRLTYQLVPEFQEVIFNEVISLSRLSDIWGWVGILSCLSCILPLVVAIRNVFLTIFMAQRRRPLVLEALRDFSTAIFLIALLIFLVISQIIYDELIIRFFMAISFPLYIVDFLVNLTISSTGMTVLYYAFIPVKVGLKRICAGAVLASVLWAVINPTLVFLLKLNPRFGIAFGSLKAIFLIFMWVYFSFCVIVLGAEFIAQWHRRGNNTTAT
ncbi:MAG: YihY/virulence factor BrkB family protein [Candidatus Magnetobacterium sp. LHC-1]|uniref:YihY/virulence factor BrkB family protein n=1 Tax=Candidatus Magnetobacterium casense TaxID=1455061 RepID=A0ABS6S542_9BACT|nr:YihY/virulence factor BrkB family protein [Candidatus Magnetobacterium casensis]MBF0606869.1 YihY/virulence factor BrkB family protein [Nitrospirota bacterium]MBV6343623.1 YihY/virulence factor BrkB family protein [Candidatus Magnetobacterium casensis]